VRILITGAEGQTGRALAELAEVSGHNVIGLSHGDLDIADKGIVSEVIRKYRPTHIINAAAYNAVDRAEDDVVGAFNINALGPAYLALAAVQYNAILIHYSSDYVFDGNKRTDYDEEDEARPISVYGRSKLLGEQTVAAISDRHYILRTAWVFSPGGSNFIARLLKRTTSHAKISLVQDVWSTPTYARDLAEITIKLVELEAPFGLYHAVGSEACTPYAWACKVAECKKINAQLEPILASSFETRARRPRRSILATGKLVKLGINIPSGIERTKDYFMTESEKNR